MRVLLEKDNVVKQVSSQKRVAELLARGFHISGEVHDGSSPAGGDNTAGGDDERPTADTVSTTKGSRVKKS